MFLPGYGPIAMPSIGQTLVLASIGAVVGMDVLSTLKQLHMESTKKVALKISGFIGSIPKLLVHVLLLITCTVDYLYMYFC
jgi:hypothetical protein